MEKEFNGIPLHKASDDADKMTLEEIQRQKSSHLQMELNLIIFIKCRTI